MAESNNEVVNEAARIATDAFAVATILDAAILALELREYNVAHEILCLAFRKQAAHKDESGESSSELFTTRTLMLVKLATFAIGPASSLEQTRDNTPYIKEALEEAAYAMRQHAHNAAHGSSNKTTKSHGFRPLDPAS